MQKLSDQWVTDFQRFGKTNMDFAALQQKLFDLDPSDRAEDLRRLTESVGDMPQESAQTEENFVQESVEIAEGTMPVEGDYSLSDFAALSFLRFAHFLAAYRQQTQLVCASLQLDHLDLSQIVFVVVQQSPY